MKTFSNVESFIYAFRDCSGGPHAECNCGKRYYDVVNDYDWYEGEFEELEADDTAIPVAGAVGLIVFEGRYYVEECECYLPRANQIVKFLDLHLYNITTYINVERERKAAVTKAFLAQTIILGEDEK